MPRPPRGLTTKLSGPGHGPMSVADGGGAARGRGPLQRQVRPVGAARPDPRRGRPRGHAGGVARAGRRASPRQHSPSSAPPRAEASGKRAPPPPKGLTTKLSGPAHGGRGHHDERRGRVRCSAGLGPRRGAPRALPGGCGGHAGGRPRRHAGLATSARAIIDAALCRCKRVGDASAAAGPNAKAQRTRTAETAMIPERAPRRCGVRCSARLGALRLVKWPPTSHEPAE
jgi:hypothetical protein